MSICCDCGKDKQAFLCLSCNDKWLDQAERRGRVEELEQLWNFIQNQPINITGHNFEKNWFSIKKRVDRRLKELEKGELR